MLFGEARENISTLSYGGPEGHLANTSHNGSHNQVKFGKVTLLPGWKLNLSNTQVLTIELLVVVLVRLEGVAEDKWDGALEVSHRPRIQLPICTHTQAPC